MEDTNAVLSSESGSPSGSDGTSQGFDSSGSGSTVVNGAEGQGHESSVPYERLKEKVDEVNSLRNQVSEYEQWGSVLNQVKQQFATPQDYEEALSDLNRRNEEAEIAAQVKKTAEEQGLDDETAGQMFQTEVVRKQFEKTTGELNKVLFNQKLTLAKTQYPDFDEDTVTLLAKKDGSDVMALAKKYHEKETARVRAIEEATIARYNAKKKTEQEQIPVEGSGGGQQAAEFCPDPQRDKAGYDAWWNKKLRAVG